MNTPAPQDLAERLADLLLGLVPADGAGKTADAERFDELREAFIAQGKLGRGKGRGGSVVGRGL